MSRAMEKRTLTLRSRDDVLAAIPMVLGLNPAEGDLVIVCVGGGPSVRVDLPGCDFTSLTGLTMALVPVLPKWRASQGVVLVAYTADRHLFDRLVGSLDTLLPGVRVFDRFRFHNWRHYGPGDTVGTETYCGSFDADVGTRADIVAEAATVYDPDEALRHAWAAYRTSGNGARAWVYHDRAVELGAVPDADLVHRLTMAIDPDDDEE